MAARVTARVTARGGRPLSITRPAATTMLHSGAAALLIALSLAGRVAADEDDDDGGGAPSALQAFVDTNPSQNSTDDSSCMIGTFGYGAVGGGGRADSDADAVCTGCKDGRTTEVWSVQPTGAMGCTVPGDDEDGEDSDDWVPSLAACKSTCVGTCPG